MLTNLKMAPSCWNYPFCTKSIPNSASENNFLDTHLTFIEYLVGDTITELFSIIKIITFIGGIYFRLFLPRISHSALLLPPSLLTTFQTLYLTFFTLPGLSVPSVIRIDKKMVKVLWWKWRRGLWWKTSCCCLLSIPLWEHMDLIVIYLKSSNLSFQELENGYGWLVIVLSKWRMVVCCFSLR